MVPALTGYAHATQEKDVTAARPGKFLFKTLVWVLGTKAWTSLASWLEAWLLREGSSDMLAHSFSAYSSKTTSPSISEHLWSLPVNRRGSLGPLWVCKDRYRWLKEAGPRHRGRGPILKSPASMDMSFESQPLPSTPKLSQHESPHCYCNTADETPRLSTRWGDRYTEKCAILWTAGSSAVTVGTNNLSEWLLSLNPTPAPPLP